MADVLTLWTSRALQGRVVLGKGRDAVGVSEVGKRLADAFRSVTREDVDAALAWSKIAPDADVLDWIGLLLDELKLGPVAGPQNEGVTPASSWRSWLGAAGRYDLDTLLSFDLARSAKELDPYSRHGWGAVCNLWSNDVGAIVRLGVSDMHVHQGAARSANLVWLRSLTSGADRGEMKAFYEQLSEVAENRKLVEDVLRKLSPNPFLRGRTSPIAEAILSRLGGAPTIHMNPRELFGAERRSLIEAWRAAARAKDRDRIERLRDLDRYFNAKCIFMSLLLQSARRLEPGLGRFREVSAAGRPDYPAARRRARAVRDLADVLAINNGVPALVRLELRIRPHPRKVDYEFGLRAFNRCRERVMSSEQPTRRAGDLDARFCVHFIRSMGEHRKSARRARDQEKRRFFGPPKDSWRGGAEGMAWRLFRLRLVRSSATFHSYRLALARLADKNSLEKLGRIPRIDVAGQERDNPPENFAFIMRLLRDNDQARKDLDGDIDKELYRPWLCLESVRREREVWLPPLGASCHAGEDFFHPLDGIAAMDAALFGFDLRDGDSIGHGLALGCIDGAGRSTIEPRQFAPAGRQFDVMLWLHRQAMTRWDQVPVEERLTLEKALDQLGDMIDVKRPGNGWAALHKLIDALRGPERSGKPSSSPEIAVLQARRTAENTERYMAPTPIQEDFDRLPKLAAVVRGETAKEIAKRGVVVEINPSSNMRIIGASADILSERKSRLEEVRRWPLLRMIEDFRDELRFAINTDNPGIFGTTVESEFQLLFEGLLELDWRRKDALDFMERCRVAGLTALR